MMTVKKLGKQGRFANQLFQYAHLRQRAGTDYCCPRWVGQTVFGLDDPPMTAGAQDIGFRFPLDSSWYDRELFQSLYVPTERMQWRRRFRDWTGSIRGFCKLLVGIHLRRGDYGTFKRKSARWCFKAPTEWYLDWLHEFEDAIGLKPDLYIASDDIQSVVSDFQDYQLFWMRPTEGLRTYLYDFHVLAQCDHLLISNSTFGFAASMLNQKCQSFWRPRLSQKKLIPYSPWNSPIVLKDELYAA